MMQRNQKIGLGLFSGYLLLYGGFVGLAAFAPEVMEQRPAFGLNLAILYGFGLILAAFVAALIYGFACRAEPAPVRTPAAEDSARPAYGEEAE